MSTEKKTESWLKITWTIAIHVAVIVTVLAMLHKAQTSFETVVIAGLTMLYAQSIIGFELIHISLRKQRLASQQEFLVLARILVPKSEKQDDISMFEQDYEQTFDALMVEPNWRWYIHFMGYGIISFIAVWNLVEAVVSSS